VTVEFRLLGDVEVRVGNARLDVGHARQRCVLVALLLNANRSVPADQLIERVWGLHPPAGARRVLSTYVSRLRRALRPADRVSIDFTPQGYGLFTDPQTVDLDLFRHLVARSRAVDDADDAAELLGDALRCWNGEPFPTLDTPWMNEARSGLEAERFAAELDRNEVALRTGRHRALLPEMTAAMRTHPLDERLAGQLVLALYRCGRQRDALTAFQEMRRRLHEELGTRPCLQLETLYRQILANDPSLAAPATTGPAREPADPTVPRQLPPAPRLFCGRTHELAELDALVTALDDGSNTVIISAVSGMGGIGKTSLAVHWAQENVDRFPDGQLYLNLRGFDPSGIVMTSGEALRSLLEALGVAAQQIPAAAETQVGLYRSLLAGRRVLVVLDNVRDEEQIRPLLPGVAGCLALVTSRHQLTGLVVADGAIPLALSPLSHTEAGTLLGRRLGADRTAAEPVAVDEIIELCARLPLALAVVGARAAGMPSARLGDLAEQLHERRDRLDALEIGDETIDVRAVFSWSYRALSHEGARMFRLLGVHPGPDISIAATASLAGCPVPAARRRLDELSRASLVSEPAPDRYTLHDLLRAYAGEIAEKLRPTGECDEAMRRIFAHYMQAADAADHLLYPFRDPIDVPAPPPGIAFEKFADAEQAMGWFVRERQVLLAVSHLEAGGAHAWRLIYFMVNYLDRCGEWSQWIEAQAKALRTAIAEADRQGQAFAYRGLQRAHLQAGLLAESDRFGQRARAAFADVGNRAAEAQTSLIFGVSAVRQGKVADGLSMFLQAQQVYESIRHDAGISNALNNAGFTYVLLGRHEEALSVCQRALEMQQEIGDNYIEGGIWDTLGFAQHHLQRFSDAIISYCNALRALRRQGDRLSEADTLVRLGDSRHATGERATAHQDWTLALQIYEELRHPDLDTLRTELIGRLDDSARSTPTSG
jgi:DNA-binding SARP family transcriptional activator/tetratricopeptide (TPR) repeat protein